jgi:hypothetical protein
VIVKARLTVQKGEKNQANIQDTTQLSITMTSGTMGKEKIKIITEFARPK